MAQNLLTPALNVFEQMALDETLALCSSAAPVLRFYHWTDGPAVTFGYAQFWDFVRPQTSEQKGPACRRPTGGGVVFHGEDLTFSLIFQSTLNPKNIYAALHAAIERTLSEQAHVASSRQGSVNIQAYKPVHNGQANGCFVNPVQDDLLLDGHKILGGAIRRFGSTVLYQGSLQCASARTNPIFRHAVAAGAARWLNTAFATVPVERKILDAARDLAHRLYETEAWNKKF